MSARMSNKHAQTVADAAAAASVPSLVCVSLIPWLLLLLLVLLKICLNERTDSVIYCDLIELS